MSASSTEPELGARAPSTSGEGGGLYGWVATVDHKRIGVLYLLTSLFFFVVGGVEALLMRLQLAWPDNHVLSPVAYNQIFTMHGTTMIFLVVMPALVGFANYLVPLMIGARDMAFPRLNAMSYWLLPFGGLLLHFSFLTGAAPSAGWFSYAPLSETPFSSLQGTDYWIVSLLLLGVASVAAGVNIIATVLALRAPGLTLRRLPLFVWMTFITAILIVLALPVLNAALVMLLIDRQLDAHFFLPSGGGSAVLWQHFFWTFGHPEVYIMALPAFGMISEVIPVFSRKPIFGYAFVAASTVAIAVLSFGVWAHHMFAVGLGHTLDLFFAAASMLIAVPTGVKVFSWTATLWGGSIRFTTSMCFALAFLLQFVVGGLSGVTFAVAPTDWQTTDTYYVVAHFHYVLFGGTAFAILAATYYWFPKMTGRLLSERWGRVHFWLTVIGFNLTFFVQHFLGLLGMPRRVYTYPAVPAWAALNLVSSIGALVMAASVVVFLANLVISLRRGAPAGDNPWDGWTLEWATTSPPPAHDFDALPPIRGRRPLWDLAHAPRAGGAERAPAPESDAHEGHLERVGVGMTTFVVSESAFFLVLVLSYVFYTVGEHAGPAAAGSLDVLKTGLYTVCLVASSLTLHLAGKRFAEGARVRFGAWLAATIGLGALFLAGQAMEYGKLFRAGVTVNTDLFATSFFTLTGFHGLHVTLGLVALSILLCLTLAGDFHERRRARSAPDGRPGLTAVRAITLYWHFVDAVWLVVFSVVYLRAF